MLMMSGPTPVVIDTIIFSKNWLLGMTWYSMVTLGFSSMYSAIRASLRATIGGWVWNQKASLTGSSPCAVTSDPVSRAPTSSTTNRLRRRFMFFLLAVLGPTYGRASC